MKKTCALLLTVIAVVVGSSFSKADLLSRIKDEAKTSQAYPCASRSCPSQEDIQSYQYIYVEGFLGDYRSSELNAISTVLQKDFTVSDSVVLVPESKKSIPANAEILYQQVLNLRAQSPHSKAILIAFSKGAPETLLMSLRHPELFRSGEIRQLLFISGALKGSPLADLWVERCSSRSLEAIPADKGLCATLREWQGGVTSLRPSYIMPVLNRAIASANAEDREFISRRLWAIQTQWGDAKAEGLTNLWPTHIYLNRFGVNDGILMTDGQKLPEGFGTNLGIFSVDHLSLLKVSQDANQLKQNVAFSRALIREIVTIDRQVQNSELSLFLAKSRIK